MDEFSCWKQSPELMLRYKCPRLWEALSVDLVVVDCTDDNMVRLSVTLEGLREAEGLLASEEQCLWEHQADRLDALVQERTRQLAEDNDRLFAEVARLRALPGRLEDRVKELGALLAGQQAAAINLSARLTQSEEKYRELVGISTSYRDLLVAERTTAVALRKENEQLREELALYRPQATTTTPSRFTDL